VSDFGRDELSTRQLLKKGVRRIRRENIAERFWDVTNSITYDFAPIERKTLRQKSVIDRLILGEEHDSTARQISWPARD